MSAEVVALGEAMVRLTPPASGRLELAQTLTVDVGGAELNVLAGLAGLGHTTSWLTRLPANALGRLIAARARSAGVGLDHVAWIRDSRAGLYFLEEGAAPRASSILYDRRDSAFTTLTPTGIDAAWFTGARYFHISGITPALNQGCFDATLAAMQLARQAGCAVSFDPNFRANLWTPEDAKQAYQSIVPWVNVLFASPEALAVFFDATGDDVTAARQVASRWDLDAVVLTDRAQHGARTCTLHARAVVDGQLYEAPSYDVEIVDRLGGGDAFVAGFLHGMLRADPGLAVKVGAALGALQHTTPGDFPCVTSDEVMELARGGAGSMRIRR